MGNPLYRKSTSFPLRARDAARRIANLDLTRVCARGAARWEIGWQDAAQPVIRPAVMHPAEPYLGLRDGRLLDLANIAYGRRVTALQNHGAGETESSPCSMSLVVSYPTILVSSKRVGEEREWSYCPLARLAY